MVLAEAIFRQALVLDPTLSEAHANIGYMLSQCGRMVEAEAAYEAALVLDPGQQQTYLNLGVLLSKQKRFAEAETAYRKALTIDPDVPAAWSNLGVLLAGIKREDEAEQCYCTAIALSPGHQNAHFNLAYLYLRRGNYARGWEYLEFRPWYALLAAMLPVPRWQGEPLAGKSLLIGFEAGHGDMIQFCRYAAQAKRAGACRVTVLCHPGLARLFLRLDGIDAVIRVDQPLPLAEWDYWSPPLSLPRLFATRLHTIPATLPYLQSVGQRHPRWDPVLSPAVAPLRVGLVWKGNPMFDNDADRSLPGLATLAPLTTVPGVQFFSLQKGAGEDDVVTTSLPCDLVDLASEITDFADTAAIIMQLDLVISVDTAVAHLSGALGKPCWVMLPFYNTDWRWLDDRSDSPWYPNAMRLFRQPEMGDWDTVVLDIATALQHRVVEYYAALQSI